MSTTIICDQETCLSSLVGVRGACVPNVDCPPFFIDDLEGVTNDSLANLARSNSMTGLQYGKDLIITAANMMLADIQGLVSDYQLSEALGELCSTCEFTPGIWQLNTGVKVRNIVASKFAVLRISKVEILCNAAANSQQVLVLDDGKNVKKIGFTAKGISVIVPVAVKYETTEMSVKVTLEDTTVKLCQITCASASGCGCSSASSTSSSPIMFSGLLAGMDTSLQYGFKICASVSCSSDLLTCSLINQTPKLFALTLLYRTGVQYYGNALLSVRNNRYAIEEPTATPMQEYYEKLYRERLAGSTKVKGLQVTISDYLRRNKDRCVQCSSISGISYATG